MCNTYIVKPRKGVAGWQAGVSANIAKLKSSLVRKSDPGLVALAEDGAIRSEIMRWGFLRPFNPAINNSRSDKLESGMWKDAYQERRCLIPVSSYFEWCAGTGGKKQANAITGKTDEWLWIAGIWEHHPEHGPCYSMVTTAAAPSVAHIHDRMPAVLVWADAQQYLAGHAFQFFPFAGPLVVKPCESPLIKTPPKPEQSSFF